jgi:hypothetical protein
MLAITVRITIEHHRLHVVEQDVLGNPAKRLERPAQARQYRLDLLIGDEVNERGPAVA